MTDRAAAQAHYRPEIRQIDLSAPRHIHLIGIGGAGMRAIGRVLLAMGHQVSGSDMADTRHVTELRSLGATVHVGHDAGHLGGVDLVARSSAVGDDNAEVVGALAAGVPVYSRAEILVAISQQRSSILVAGTHGKTTTSSMLAVLLDRVGLDPSFIIGSDVAHFGTGAAWRSGRHLVVEADESDGTALVLDGDHAIVTSLDPDHLEHYGSIASLNQAFVDLVDSVEGTIAVCVDDPDTAPLLGRRGVVTYGQSPDADLRIEAVRFEPEGARFAVTWRGGRLPEVNIGLAGLHNVLNACGALLVALELGIDPEAAVDGLAGFSGVARRFERRGEVGGITFVDDYAHLPAEVEAAIAAARTGRWSRVVVSYQPHRFTRTKALGHTFARSFDAADHLVLTDLYPAGEYPIEGVSGRVVLDAVIAHNRAQNRDLSVSWQATLDDVVDHLSAILEPGDLCLTLGAGDLTTVPDRVMARLDHV